MSGPFSSSRKAGFALSEVTRDLHANGICGVMTDYEEKFHTMGTPINRCVGTMVELPAEMAGWIDPLDKPCGKEEAEEGESAVDFQPAHAREEL